MSTQATGQARESDSFDLKSSVLTVPVLKLLDTNIDRIADQLRRKIQAAPDFFHNAPIVIDLSQLEQSNDAVDFPFLVGIMRGLGMQPIGVQGGSATQRESAELMELAVLGRGSTGRGAPAKKETSEKEEQTEHPQESASARKTSRSFSSVRSSSRPAWRRRCSPRRGSARAAARTTASGRWPMRHMSRSGSTTASPARPRARAAPP